ncbi:hypothetical protein Pelo_18411 [Pelomyxa schiedti]|nr:hypothetical protein Pelo_18411 [Pelomyxa schiedti]
MAAATATVGVAVDAALAWRLVWEWIRNNSWFYCVTLKCYDEPHCFPPLTVTFGVSMLLMTLMHYMRWWAQRSHEFLLSVPASQHEGRWHWAWLRGPVNNAPSRPLTPSNQKMKMNAAFPPPCAIGIGLMLLVPFLKTASTFICLFTSVNGCKVEEYPIYFGAKFSKGLPGNHEIKFAEIYLIVHLDFKSFSSPDKPDTLRP